ncbi:MAG TPA: TonB-dependent receptor [Bacteroidota bacterium]|nr:TonB-dependent receptor [Bacteroidota bacterium]
MTSQSLEQVTADFTLDSLLTAPVSTAAKYKQTSAEAPASISVITSADIQTFQYRTLADVLNRVRGMYSSNDRNYAYVGVRGFSRPSDYNNRLLLLVDGHTINEDVYGSAFLGTEFGISLDAIERIEIVRGPGSALYGAGAMFGVVNVITKDYHSFDGVRGAVSLGNYGQRTGSLQFGKELGRGSGLFISAEFGKQHGADFYSSEYDTDSTNHGIATNADWESFYGVTAKLSLQNFALRSGATWREKAIPTASFGTIFNDPREQTRDERQFIDMTYAVPLPDNAELSLRLYGDRYKYAGVYPYEDLSLDHSTGLWWGTEVRLQWDPASNDRLVIGSEFQDDFRSDYILSYGGVETFNRNYPFSVLSLFAQNEFQWFENLTLTTGLRYDRHSVSGGMLSPRVAVNWNVLDGGVMKLLVGRSFRAPNFYELNYFDNELGFKSNPSLSAELITTWEVAFEQRFSDHVRASLSLYRNEMVDLIDQVVDPSDSLTQFQNQDKMIARGVEAELNYVPFRALHCYGLLSLQKTESEITHAEPSNSPAWLARLGISYKFSQWVEASLEASHDSRRLALNGSATDPFTLVHTRLNVFPLGEHLMVSLGIRNLFDTRYTFPGGYEHRQVAIEQLGREVTLKLQSTF